MEKSLLVLSSAFISVVRTKLLSKVKLAWTMKNRAVWHQIYATFVVNLGVFSFSLAYGWSSPNSILLQSNESPLDCGALTPNEFSLAVSALAFGTGTSLLIFGWISDTFGRKWAILIGGPITITSWSLLEIGTTVYYLYIARFLVGCASATFSIIAPIFIAEISNDNIRGLLLASCCVITNLGTLISFIAGEYLTYYQSPYIGMVAATLFIILFSFLPETPHYLAKQRLIKDEKQSLEYYKGLTAQNVILAEKLIDEEEMKTNFSAKQDNQKVTLSDLNSRYALKSFLCSFILYQGSAFSGTFVMLNYSAFIFKESGSNLAPNINSIIIGFILLVASFLSFIVIEKVGRRVLLLISTCGAAIFYAILGAYFYMKHIGVDLSSVNGLPLICLSSIMFLSSMGIISVAFLVPVEILPPKVKNIASCVLYILLSISVFLLNRYFNAMVALFQLHTCVWFFSVCCISEMVFVAIFLPETKGKSFNEIAKDMGR